MVQNGETPVTLYSTAGLQTTGPHRLARPRTSGSQPEDTGSNPVGAALKTVKSVQLNVGSKRDCCGAEKRRRSARQRRDKVPSGALSFLFSVQGYRGMLYFFLTARHQQH